MTAAETYYASGHCAVGSHDRCRGLDAGVACQCACGHRPIEPEPEPAPPLLELGARVVCAPGTRWAGEDLTGAELEVIEVHPYPPEIGGPVFICRWPGTTTRPAYGVVLGRDKLA